MKRYFITLLAVFYLSVSFGANISMHYCMGELVEWDVNSHDTSEKSDCDNCGMPTGSTEDCCKNEVKQLKLDSDQKITKNDSQVKIKTLDILTEQVQVEIHQVFSSVPLLINTANAPPAEFQNPVYILNCNFRI